MKKSLEDEIDEIIETEIYTVRKNAQKYLLGNIFRTRDFQVLKIELGNK